MKRLNHAGVADADMLVVLNDNGIGIDPNVGALKEYLTDITTSQTYNKLRDDVWHLFGKLPVGKRFTRDMASKLEAGIKGLVSKRSNLFESLNFRYFGPIDGHNITKLVDTLYDLKTFPVPSCCTLLLLKAKAMRLPKKTKPNGMHPVCLIR